MNPSTSLQTNATTWWKRIPRWSYALGALALALVIWKSRSGGGLEDQVVTFEARRGPLDITVIEGGSVEALESQMIQSEIRGHQGTKILRIVDEGYLVTEEDVRTNKVLVELDSSELKQLLLTEETELESRFAMYTEAQQAYEIQLVQNQSDIKAALQNVKFARMDLEKFMGESAAADLINELDLKIPEAPTLDSLPTFDSSFPEAVPAGGMAGGLMGQVSVAGNVPSGNGQSTVVVDSSFEGIPPINLDPIPPVDAPRAAPVNPLAREAASINPEAFDLNFSKYASEERLGDGSAKQDLRKKRDDQLVAEKELKLAETKLEGTKQLYTKDFITKTELENEQITVEKMELNVATARTALELYKRYEFPKLAEETVSKYEEALQSLDRAYKEAISKLAQARARKMSAENRFGMGKTQVKDLRDQLGKCIITAEKTGLVVYGGGSNPYVYYGNQEQIREGATVRERQAIITIPDMTRMSVTLKIHESHIKKITKELKSRITLDAFPDEQLTGRVTRVGVLPDSQNRWMSPDLKVYLTTVTIDGTYEWVKPGMSAKVEILVNHLKDTVYVPLQAVRTVKGRSYCHVVKHGATEEREIITGDFNEEFIAVKEGLNPGDLVMIRPPSREESDDEEKAVEAAPVDEAPKEQASAK